MDMKPAPFIAIEGMDGSGKTTLVRRLEEATRLLSDYRYAFTREPGGTPLAENIRSLLLSEELSGTASGRTQLLGFFYARSDHLEMIRKERAAGHIVITDRFDASTFAYQVYAQSETGHERDELDELFWMLRNNIVYGENSPTLYLSLDLPPEVAYARRAADAAQEKNHYDIRPLEFYERQREGYRVFFEEIRGWGNSSEVAIIDATKSPEEVFGEALRIIRKHVRSY